MRADATTAVSAPPSHFYVPDGAVFTIADEIADLMTDLGYQVDEPERLACRALYAQKADGDWIGLESGIVCARQNIKTTVMLAGAIHDLWVQDVPKVNWTAHEFKTSTETFGEVRRLIDTHPWLSRRVKRVRESNGKEGIDLHSGARLNILARTKRSGRGMGAGRLYGDEALFWTDQQLGAIVPTMSAQANAHLVHGSSPGLVTSKPLRSLRERGRSGDDPYLGWVEWGSPRKPCLEKDCTHTPGTPGCQLDVEHNWWLANCALDRRISRDYVRQERLTLPTEEFMRERMGWWEDPPEGGGEVVYPLEPWETSRDDDSSVGATGFLVFGVDVSWDRETAYVAVAGYRDDDLIHGQLIHSCNPVDVAAYLEDRVRRFHPAAVVLQGGGSPVASLLEDIVRAVDGQCPVHDLTGPDISRACGVTHDVIKSGQLRHHGQPSLDHALRRAVSRPLGDGWALDRKKSPIDIAPLVALTNAVYELTITEKPGDPGVWFV